MNRDRHRYWSAYIDDVRKLMLLADWHIVLDRKLCTDENCGARVNFSGPTHRALITLGKHFESEPRAAQRH